MPRKSSNGRAQTGEDLALLTALLSNATIRKAGAEAGLSEATVYRRLQDATFRKQLKEMRLRTYSNALSRLQVSTGTAVEVLQEIMQDREQPPSVRVKAALSVLALANVEANQPDFVDMDLKSDVERIVESL
jgi:hypothetical protein